MGKLELWSRAGRFYCVMKTAKSYWEYAQECMQLARAMPQHRASLLDMASVWDGPCGQSRSPRKKGSIRNQKRA